MVLVALAFWPLWSRDQGLALCMTLLFGALFAIGIVLLAEPGQLPAGLAMLAAAVLLVVSWANEWGGGPLPLLSQATGELWILLGGWALYRSPDRTLSPRDRAMFGAMFVWFLINPWLRILTSRPEWHEFPPDSWWPSLIADPAVYEFISHAVDISIIGCALVYIAAWLTKLGRARPVERKLRTANSVAAIVAASVCALVPLARAMGAAESTMDMLYIAAGAAILAVPLAFLVAVVRRKLARTTLTILLPQLHGSSNVHDMVGALRSALADPELDVLPWSDAAGDYVDLASRPVGPWMLSGRLVTAVSSPEGRRLALLVTDPTLHTDPELVRAAAAAVSLTLQNALLVETVQRQLWELRQTSMRIVKAGDTERRRLERDLHDGAQQHFLAVGLMIGAAEEMTSDPVTRGMLAQTRTQLEHALAELRRLARGLHPGSLRLGLAVAIRQECGRYPMAISVALPESALPETTEMTAYYAICEAVTNAVKHAQAGQIDIRGFVTAGALTVIVHDDGRGGARVGAGKGLTGIIDRVQAIGGDIHIVSPTAAGTRVTLRIPCV